MAEKAIQMIISILQGASNVAFYNEKHIINGVDTKRLDSGTIVNKGNDMMMEAVRHWTCWVGL